MLFKKSSGAKTARMCIKHACFLSDSTMYVLLGGPEIPHHTSNMLSAAALKVDVGAFDFVCVCVQDDEVNGIVGEKGTLMPGKHTHTHRDTHFIQI